MDGLFSADYGQIVSFVLGWIGTVVLATWLVYQSINWGKHYRAAKEEPEESVGDDPKVLDNAKNPPGIFVGVKGVHD